VLQHGCLLWPIQALCTVVSLISYQSSADKVLGGQLRTKALAIA